MRPRFVTKSMHAFLDYPVALALLLGPFLLDLGSSHALALWLSVGTGIAAFVLTMFTDHKLGVFRVLPYRFHLAVDAIVGAVFLLAPVVFGFAGFDAWFYWINGAAVMIVVGSHMPESESRAVAAVA